MSLCSVDSIRLGGKYQALDRLKKVTNGLKDPCDPLTPANKCNTISK